MMMGFGFLGLLLVGGALLAILLGGLGLMSRKDGGIWPGGQRQPTARQILDERFARGEISTEEYEMLRPLIEH